MLITEKRKIFLINFAYFAVLIAGAVLIFKYTLQVLAPFVAAFVIAYLLKRPIAFLSEKTGLNRRGCAAITVLIFYCAAGSLLSLISAKAITGLVALVGSIPTIYDTHVHPFFMRVLLNVEDLLLKMDPALVDVLDDIAIEQMADLGQTVSGISVKVMGIVSGVAAGLPGLFVKLVLMIISTFFIAMDYERLTGFCYRQMNFNTKKIVLEIKEYVVGTLWVCIRSYALIMSITFIELSIALSILKISHSVLVAFCIAIFDILPVLGTGGVMIPWTILMALKGNIPLALGLLATYIIITVIRNIIEPKIVGSQLGLHPVVTLSSMFAGAQFFGVIGLFGFPILLSLLCHLNRHEVIKIFK